MMTSTQTRPFLRGRQQLSVIKTDVVEAESLIRKLAGEEAKRNPLGFSGNISCVYFKLPYVPPYESFKELRKLILRVKEGTGLRASFKGVVAIEATEWLGHETEEYFTVILKYLYDHRDTWVNAVVLNNPTSTQLLRFVTLCAKYISPRVYDVCLFSDFEELVKRIQDTAAAQRGLIDRSAAEDLASILMSEKTKAAWSLSLIERAVADAIFAAENKTVTPAIVASIMKNPYSTISLIGGKWPDHQRSALYDPKQIHIRG